MAVIVVSEERPKLFEAVMSQPVFSDRLSARLLGNNATAASIAVCEIECLQSECAEDSRHESQRRRGSESSARCARLVVGGCDVAGRMCKRLHQDCRRDGRAIQRAD